MAITLNLVQGPNIATLNSASAELVDYVPLRPNLAPADLMKLLWAHPKSKAIPYVTESAVVNIRADSASALQTAIDALESIVTYGAGLRQQTQSACRAFVKFSPDGLTAYRSEIIGGGVDYDRTALSYPYWNQARLVKATVVWTRMPYWEADTETAIQMVNGGGSGSALTLFNHDDGDAGHDNWGEIAAATTACGPLPMAVRIVLTNNGASMAGRRFYLAHKALGSACGFTHVLEAESGSINATYGVSASDANCSNGSRVNVSNLPSSVASLIAWNVGETQAGYATSNWLRMMARFAGLPSSSTIRLRITLKDSTTGVTVAQSKYTNLNTSDALQVVGTIQLSPNLEGRVTSGSVRVVLEGIDSAACGFGIDFVDMLSVEAGRGFRYLRPMDESASGVAVSGGILVDNGIDGGLYIDGRQNIYQAFGNPLMLLPNALQRVFVYHDKQSGCAPILSTTTLSIYARPRRIAL